MASIIEKETGQASERGDDRFSIRQSPSRSACYLQTDPTVIYGMGDQFKGNIQTRPDHRIRQK